MIDASKCKNKDGSPLSPTDEARLLGPCGAIMNFMRSHQLTVTSVASPVEVWGTVDKYPLHFRARWNNWIATFYRLGIDARKPEDGDILVELGGYYDPSTTGDGASTMELDVAFTLIQAAIQSMHHALMRETEGTTR